MTKNLFAIGLLAMVAFASCSKSDDEDNTNTPQTTGVASLEENFQAGTAESLAKGWTTVKVKGYTDWKAWSVSASGENNLAQINSYSKEAPATDCESWLITPVLDIDKAAVKTLTFYSTINKYSKDSKVEVYLMDKPDPATATVKEALAVNIAGSGTNITTGSWIYANIDLSGKKGVCYIGFKYVGTTTVATDFRMDNVRFGLAEIKNNTGITKVTNTILAEDFAGATAGDPINASGTALAADATSNFPTVAYAYAAGGCVKLGTSSKVGSITSKALDLSVNKGTIKVSFRIKGWSAAGSINVTVGNQTQPAKYTAMQFDKFEDVTLTFTGCTASSTVKFETPMSTTTTTTAPVRAFVDDIHIFY